MNPHWYLYSQTPIQACAPALAMTGAQALSPKRNILTSLVFCRPTCTSFLSSSSSMSLPFNTISVRVHVLRRLSTYSPCITHRVSRTDININLEKYAVVSTCRSIPSMCLKMAQFHTEMVFTARAMPIADGLSWMSHRGRFYPAVGGSVREPMMAISSHISQLEVLSSSRRCINWAHHVF